MIEKQSIHFPVTLLEATEPVSDFDKMVKQLPEFKIKEKK